MESGCAGVTGGGGMAQKEYVLWGTFLNGAKFGERIGVDPEMWRCGLNWNLRYLDRYNTNGLLDSRATLRDMCSI